MQKNYLLALLSSFLLWLAWPPIPFTAPILLVALVPFLFAVTNIIQSNFHNKGRKIFQLSFAAFFVWNTACIYWVFNSLNAVMPNWIALLISLIPFGLAALLMAIVIRLYYSLTKILNPLYAYAGLICLWIGYEYLHQSWDLAFPWMNLGNGFAQMHQLVQWYEYTGVYGGTLWILLCNIILFELIRIHKQKHVTGKRLSYILVFLITVPILLSLTIYTNYKEKVNPSSVVVVQPNIDPYGKFGAIPEALQLERLIKLSDSVAQPNTEYFIWPETALPQNIEESQIRSTQVFSSMENFLSKYKNGNIISGVSSYSVYDTLKTKTTNFDEKSNTYYDNFNAAIQVENSPNVQFYHKSKLVPGVEQLPFSNFLSFMKPLFAGFGGSTGGYGKQKEPSVFYSQSGIGVSPVICYESIWGEYVAQSVEKGSQFIAVITNDGWWGNTSGKDQHLEYAKLRAIETRRWVARSANTGISAFINQRGDIVKKSNWWEATALIENINLNDDITFYTKHKDFIALAGCFGSGIFLIVLLIGFIKRK